MEEVFPEWVSESADGYKYITEYGTTALLVEALRELRREKNTDLNEILRATRQELAEAHLSHREAIRSLTAANAELAARLAKLEALVSVTP